MADPYWSGTPWDAAATYAEGAQVSYDGYRYQAMTAISAGDNPRTATYSLLGGTFRKWKVWDYPASYIMARLRGLPGHSVLSLPEEVRTICVRDFYLSGSDPGDDSYTAPDSMSSAGYGMPKGMDSNWPQPDYWDSVYAPSAAAYEEGEPKSYSIQGGADDAIVYQPNTVSAKIGNDFNGPGLESYLLPAWSDETQGQMISSYQTFSRGYNFALDGSPPYAGDNSYTPSFQDNWEATRTWAGYSDVFFIKDTDPDLNDDT